MIEGRDVAQHVCNFVNSEAADVVVMPASSHNRLARALLGDLTASVTGCVNACLLLVRGEVEAEWDKESQKVLAEKEANSNVSDSAVDPSHLLQQLISLRDAGLLTTEEFETKKAVLQKQ